jgi:hypothetical protein
VVDTNRSGVATETATSGPSNDATVVADAMTMFKDKSLDFLGLSEIGVIGEPLKTENVEVVVRSEFADMTFSMEDGRGLHFEEEVSLSTDDLLRSCSYHVWLTREYKRKFVTVFFVKKRVSIREVNDEQLSFRPIIVECDKIDADAMLERLKKRITAGEAINELELIYLPLFHSAKMNPTELFRESTKLIRELRAEDHLKQKILALAFVLAGKVVEPAQLEAFWEEVRSMGNKILEFAEAYGIRIGEARGEERGEKRGILIGEERLKLTQEESAKKMLAKGFGWDDIIDISGISPERLKEIAGGEAV